MSGILILSREIASAMFRVSEIIKNQKIRDTLENAAILLVSEENVAPKIDHIKNIVLFCGSLRVVNPLNIEVLMRELGNLQRLVSIEAEKAASLDISPMFSFSDVISGLPNHGSRENEAPDSYNETPAVPDAPQDANLGAGIPSADPFAAQDDRYEVEDESFGNYGKYDGYDVEASASTARRPVFDSERIVDLLRSGNKVSFKELESAFPDVSSRTVRRALDILVREGKVDVIRQGQNRFYFLVLANPTAAPSIAQSVPEARPLKKAETVGTFKRISTNNYSLPRE